MLLIIRMLQPLHSLSNEIEVIQSGRVHQVPRGASHVAISGLRVGAHHAVATILLPQAQVRLVIDRFVLDQAVWTIAASVRRSEVYRLLTPRSVADHACAEVREIRPHTEVLLDSWLT